MVLKADQERVKTLLKDTITLLCRNGLSFQAKFCIDAVIGVTLDDSELFYMSMNEVIRSEKAVLREEEVEEQVSPSKRPSESRRKRHKRRRMKQEAQSGGEEEEEDSASQDSDSGAADNPSFMSQVKHEVGEASGEDSNDIVFIKQELDQSWPPDGDQSYYSGPSNTGEGDTAYRPASGDLDTSYSEHTDLSGVSLVPVGGTNTEASAVWSQGTPSYSGRGRGRGQMRTTSNTQQGEIQAGANQQVKAKRFFCDICGAVSSSESYMRKHRSRHDGKYPYSCGVCGKGCASTTQLNGHMVLHTGQKEYQCPRCGKEYSYKNKLLAHQRLCRSRKLYAKIY